MSNSFGTLFRMTTWGESHGKAMGVVVDGCPAGLPLAIEEIQEELALRQPGKTPYTSPRGEKDKAELLSGVFEGKTTGAPISILIANEDRDSSPYDSVKDLLRPGHANFTYLEKYGIFDYRGGGRASARETVCRVAAGAVAKKLLHHVGMEGLAYIKEIGGISYSLSTDEIAFLRDKRKKSLLFCPDVDAERAIVEAIEKAKLEGDSLGGVIEWRATLPVALGDPVYEKLEANLAKAFLSIPATKGVEFGAGFAAARMRGSEHNDAFAYEEGMVRTKTNHAGGTLGGISTGMPLVVRIAFKPTSSIRKAQETLNRQHEAKEFKIPEGSRHDPCVAIRAVPVVEAMGALVLADAWLRNKGARL